MLITAVRGGKHRRGGTTGPGAHWFEAGAVHGGGGSAGGICGSTVAPPARYQHVVCSRSRTDLTTGPASHRRDAGLSLALQCSYFTDYDDEHPADASPSTSHDQRRENPNTVNDCKSSRAAAHRRQHSGRRAGRADGASYVEGATSGCSDSGNAALPSRPSHYGTT
jgi:hypothetical protein